MKFFRFSLEWARLEPRQGWFNPAAVARYHQIFDCLHRCGRPFAVASRVEVKGAAISPDTDGTMRQPSASGVQVMSLCP